MARLPPALTTLDTNTLMVVKSRLQMPHNCLTVEEVEQQRRRDHKIIVNQLDFGTWPRLNEAEIAERAAKEAAEHEAIEARKKEKLAKEDAAKKAGMTVGTVLE